MYLITNSLELIHIFSELFFPKTNDTASVEKLKYILQLL
jgi:hypothetical protein